MAKPTRTYQLIEKLLDAPLDDFVAGRRDAGESFESIAFELSTTTGERITAQTLRNWFPEPQPAAS